MAPLQGNSLLLAAALAVVALIYLIAVRKLNPFVTLIVVSLALGVAVGMPMGNIVKAFETGVGNTLGHIALVVGLGTMLGKMMAESGGAERIARTLIQAFGEKNAHWAMMVVAFIIGLPVFFEVGFVLLIPIAFNVAKRTGTPILMVGLPMVAGLSVVHGLIPPHPAALLAVTAYQADIGKTILYALIVGLPTAIIAGPLFAMLISRHVKPDPDNPLEKQFVENDRGRELPPFGITLFTILLPVVLMLIGSWADLLTTPKSLANDLLKLAGNSVMALLIAALVSFYTFGRARGFSREAILKFTNECLAPIATITLVVGAGGGFGQILRDSGVSKAIVAVAMGASLSPLLLGWVVA
ncbi:gluconate:H+ symporter, partial [Ralstonia solanacearum]